MANAAKSQSLPQQLSLNTRLFLQRLERQGITSTKKLSPSHWETINRLEAAAASVPHAPLQISRGGR